jgi:hypothetical protein
MIWVVNCCICETVTDTNNLKTPRELNKTDVPLVTLQMSTQYLNS